VLALGICLIVSADLGAAPWDVFHLGLSRITGLPLGRTLSLTGLLVMALGLPLGVRPTFATVLNMALIGTFVDLIRGTSLVPIPSSAIQQFVLLAGGIVLCGLGAGIYLSPGLGAGPRDGFMLGLAHRTGVRIWTVHASIEVTVVALGYLLGARPGVGTLITSGTAGYFVERFLRLMKPVTQKLLQLVERQQTPRGRTVC